jgi:hypothetical protein
VPINLAVLKAQRFACLSTAVSLAEILIVWGGVAIAFALPHLNWHWMGWVFHYTVMAGLSSIILAAVGLFRDPDREFAILALVLGLFTTGVCGIALSG